MDACEPWGRGPGHTHPSPSLGSPCGPTWGRTMWYLPMGSGETTWHELPCPERDAGRAPIWLETTVIAHSSKPSSCCHRAGACHGLWGGTTQYSTGLHLALLPCSRASLPGCRGPGKGICAGALRIETEGTKLRKSPPPHTHTYPPTTSRAPPGHLLGLRCRSRPPGVGLAGVTERVTKQPLTDNQLPFLHPLQPH